MKNQNLKQALRNLYDDFSKRDLPQYVTDRLKKIMKKNSVELNRGDKETMHEAYGEPNDELGQHLVCEECGFCKTCKDCEKLHNEVMRE